MMVPTMAPTVAEKKALVTRWPSSHTHPLSVTAVREKSEVSKDQDSHGTTSGVAAAAAEGEKDKEEEEEDALAGQCRSGLQSTSSWRWKAPPCM